MNPFKKFCISFVILSAFMLLSIQPVLFFLNLGVVDSPGRTIDNWFRIKEAHAKNSSGKKIFVLSCSTALYAADTELMEKELGITSVNFGTTVSLRQYMFNRIRASLSSGDIVLMPLEYHVYSDRPLEQEVFVYVLEYDRAYFDNLPLIDKIKFIYRLDASFLIKRLIRRKIKNEYGDDGSYFLNSKYLNANGDLTSNTYETRTYKKPAIPPEYNFSGWNVPGNKMRQVIYDFVDYCRSSGVKVYATWPPLYPQTGKKEFYGHDAEVAENIKKFWEAVNVPLLGDYRDAFFEADDCYNGAGHLNSGSKGRYTEHLIELIEPYI